MHRIVLLASVLGTLALVGCTTTNNTPQKTQLEIRELQTRNYSTQDTKGVMKVILDVLQDDGFIVKNASSDMGLLAASKDVDIEDSRDALNARTLGFLGGCGNSGCIYLAPFTAYEGAKNAKFTKNAAIEVTANVSEFGKETRVRVNFQRRIMDNQGGVQKVEQIQDGQFYQEFFGKVDKGLFIQREKL